jgi:hypothetical protein
VLPAFPTPQEWQLGAEMVGPIMSRSFDQATKTRSYDSPFLGHMPSPYRNIQFNGECKALTITVGDTSRQGFIEIWTPAGILTWTRPDGFLELSSFDENVAPGSLLRADAPIRINRRGQVLLPMTSASGFAILLATPLAGTH